MKYPAKYVVSRLETMLDTLMLVVLAFISSLATVAESKSEVPSQLICCFQARDNAGYPDACNTSLHKTHAPL
jgi:hypothetical protein